MPTQKFWRGTPYARPLADRGGKGREGRKTEREKRGRKQEKGKRGKLEQGRHWLRPALVNGRANCSVSRTNEQNFA